jgi:hypothetical protein
MESLLMPVVFRNLCYISLLLWALPASADSIVAGVHPGDQYQLGGQVLTLNGAGVRSKFFVKIYVGALYLGTTTGDARRALASPGPKSMQMIILYKEIAADKIAAGWTDGFRANLSETDNAALATRLQQFNALFPALRRDDRVYMDYAPGLGTTLKINDSVKGRIPGADFFTALLRVWIGEHPADAGLKLGLLGN